MSSVKFDPVTRTFSGSQQAPTAGNRSFGDGKQQFSSAKLYAPNKKFNGIPKNALWTTAENKLRATINWANKESKARTLKEAHQKALELERSLGAEVTDIHTDKNGNIFGNVCMFAAGVCGVFLLGVLASGGGTRKRSKKSSKRSKKTRKAVKN